MRVKVEQGNGQMSATQGAIQAEADQTGRNDERKVDRSLDRVVMEASALGGTEVPNRVLIAPWGEVRSPVGSFILDEEAGIATIAAFEEHQTDLPVDYEHQTLGGAYTSPTGQAPAAGWIKALSVVSPLEAAQDESETEAGLWAEVEWTPEAQEQLRGRQYRYLSPVALVRRSDRRLVGIHSVALTNKPAIVGMRPVVQSDAPVAPGETVMIPATAELRSLLRADDSAADEVVLVAAAERIRTLEEAERLRAASERVSRAMSAGKLTAPQRDWAMLLARRDPAAFDQWEASAPVVVPLGRLPLSVEAGAGGSPDRRSMETAARAEWRANRRFLEKICTEEAYVASALRQCET
ncbi:MAG: hypothetical protein JXQ75_06985 [Phycisphaerae bacterium]|nr:hypothetical protein [Phycisphaerae bacterium]